MTWRPLPLSALASAQLPPFLISAVFDDHDAYIIHLTDLTCIWRESLDRKAIIRRSREEDTSIDPGSSGQFEIFLDKLRLGLEGGDGTTCALTVMNGSENGKYSKTGEEPLVPNRPALVLNVTIKLPGGLMPLQWPVRLEAAPQTVMTSQLVLPLLRAQHMRTRELEGLQEVLRQKDHVIEKLVENFKSDLSEVFPQGGRPGRKGEWKGDKVKGMPKFEYNEWRRTLDVNLHFSPAQLMGEVFASKTAVMASVEKQRQYEEAEEEEEEDGDWWERMQGITINLTTGKIGKGKKEKTLVKQQVSPPRKPSPPPKDEESTEDEAFQVQLSPKKIPSLAGATLDDDVEDHLNGPSPQNENRDNFPKSPPQSTITATTSKPKKKLGAIGGKRSVSKSPLNDDESTADEEEIALSPPPQEEAPKIKKTLGKIGGKKQPSLSAAKPQFEPEPELPAEAETESGSSSPNPTAKKRSQSQSSILTIPKSPTPAPITTLSGPSKPKRKLGQIGGKKRVIHETTPVPDDPLKAEPALSPTKTPTPVVKKKLGIVGKKRRDSSSPTPALASTTDGERGKVAVKLERAATPEVKRETSQERADLKRERLKRELEEKAKAPVKKKRKF